MIKRNNSDSGPPAFPELEKARGKLGGVVSQLREVDSKLEAALAEKREFDTARDSILARAEILLEGGEALPERDLSGEIRNLNEQREILRKAVELQQAKVDELTREASSAEYRRLKPRYLVEIRRMITAVESYEAALAGMRKIRGEMTEAGLREIFPHLAWPGIKPGDIQRQRDAFEARLRVLGMADALK